MGKVLKKVPIVGDLLGGDSKPAPLPPGPVKFDAPVPRKTNIDPNRSAALAKARRRRERLAKSQGRKSFRIDLSAPTADSQTIGRTGINISG